MYDPSALPNGSAKSNRLQHFLESNPEIEFIHCQFMDYSSVIRVRVASKHWALSLEKSNSPITVQSPILTAALVDGSVLLEDIQIGVDQLWPDWNTLKLLPHHPGTAQVFCFVQEEGIWDGKGFRRCPRTRLMELTKTAKEKYNMDFLVGVEIEFMIMEAWEDVPPIAPVKTNTHPYSSAGLRNGYLPILEEIVRTLTKVGIIVRQFHQEEGSGGFEISTEPLPPLQAADALVYSQEAIRTICFKHGLHATMHPKPFEKSPAIGSHMHLSISQIEAEESFLAGMLESWAALSAFYAPNFDSYARLKPDQFMFWGVQNRSAAIRKIKAGHWELRGVDGTANPYLTLLSIITSGLLGLETRKELAMRDPKKFLFKWFAVEQHRLDEKDVGNYGIRDRSASSLKVAIELLKNDEALIKALGPEIVDRYIKVKTKEEENFSNLTGTERRALTLRVF